MAGMDGGWIPMESSSQLCLLNISFEELKVEVGLVVLDGSDILIIMHYVCLARHAIVWSGLSQLQSSLSWQKT